MQARKSRSHDKITTKTSYFSGDEVQPSNQEKSRNSSSSRRRSAKELSKRNLLSKQNQTAETLEWLSENYELIQGVCVPRCVLYTHYLDFCKKRKFTPAGPATFGKLIRQRFPKLTTRRLGTRGQSKYHYYGISIKESSVYYHSVYSGKGLTRFSSPEGRKKGITKKFSLDKKGGNTLPEFPSASEMILNENLSVEKVETFIIMYRTHCQRLLDTVMNANFNEVHKFLLHFWRGMPQHMVPALECAAVIDIIVVCDSLLYKIFNDVLVPSCIQDIPDSLTEEIQDFAVTFVNSLESCLENSPALLKNQKLRVAKNFVRLLKRNMTFISLAQTARPVFLSYESMSGILNEFRCLDLKKILSELLFLTEQETVELPILLMFIEEFEHLLVKQAPIEAYAEWFDSIVEEYVLKDETKMNYTSDDLSKRSQTFLTSWSFITSRILQELTLKGAPTFGSFQLIIMMFEEYILLIIENQLIAQLDEDLKHGLRRHLKGSKETTNAEQSSQVQNSMNTKKHELNEANRHNEKQQHSKQRAPLLQNKDQQTSFQEEIQQFQSLENPHSTSQSYEAQKNPNCNFPQHRLQPSIEQLHNAACPSPQDGFPTGEVYLGINAVPSEIFRIENIRGNQTHLYNLMSTHNEGNSFDFSRIAAENNTQNSLQTSTSGFQASSYICAQFDQGAHYVRGQSQGQGQFPGHYQGQDLSQNQVSYSGNVHQGEGQNTNQGHFESLGQGQSYFRGQGQPAQNQGHDVRSYHAQGQNQRIFRDYQCENRILNHEYSQANQYRHSENHSVFEHNISYNQTSNNDSYFFRGNTSIGQPTDHQNSSLSHSNREHQEKTSLPSFFQLSSQLSSNTRLSATY